MNTEPRTPISKAVEAAGSDPEVEGHLRARKQEELAASEAPVEQEQPEVNGHLRARKVQEQTAPRQNATEDEPEVQGHLRAR